MAATAAPVTAAAGPAKMEIEGEPGASGTAAAMDSIRSARAGSRFSDNSLGRELFQAPKLGPKP